jgi:hypothetical protein
MMMGIELGNLIKRKEKKTGRSISNKLNVEG